MNGRLFWDEAHRLKLAPGDVAGAASKSEAVVVHATCCFPWSYPTDYISLRNDTGEELAFVSHMADLPADQQAVLTEALRRRNFIPEIVAIHTIVDDQELYVWSVMTSAGPRKFLTERRNHIRRLGGGKVVLRDVANDMLAIPDIDALDAKSYGLIRSQMD